MLAALTFAEHSRLRELRTLQRPFLERTLSSSVACMVMYRPSSAVVDLQQSWVALQSNCSHSFKNLCFVFSGCPFGLKTMTTNFMKTVRSLPGGYFADQVYRSSAYVPVATAPLMRLTGKRIIAANGYYYYYIPPGTFSAYQAHPLYRVSSDKCTVEALAVNMQNAAFLRSPSSTFVESTYVVHAKGPDVIPEHKRPKVYGGMSRLQELTNYQHTVDRKRYQLVASRTKRETFRLHHINNRINATLLTLQGVTKQPDLTRTDGQQHLGSWYVLWDWDCAYLRHKFNQ